MLTLGFFIKFVKLYTNNINQSDERAANDLLSNLIQAANIKGNDGFYLYLDKSRISKIINHKVDVPSVLRSGLDVYNIRELVEENLLIYIDEYIANENGLKKDLLDLMKENDFIFDENTKLNTVLAEALFLAIRNRNDISTTEVSLFKNGKTDIKVIKNDLFKYGFGNKSRKKNIIVIPTDSEFTMKLSTDIENVDKLFISENTIHGQWINRLNKNNYNISEIKERIKQSVYIDGYKINCNIQNKYSIGTISVIELDNAIYYLTAISNFDDSNCSVSSKEYIAKSIKSILMVYDKFGQGYDLYMPLMGTGLSRVSLSYQESFELITCILKENISLIHSNVSIVILPSEYDSINIDGVI